MESETMMPGWRPQDLGRINVIGEAEKKLIFEVIAEVWIALGEAVKDGYDGKGRVLLKIAHWRGSELSFVVNTFIETYFEDLNWRIIFGWSADYSGGQISFGPIRR